MSGRRASWIAGLAIVAIVTVAIGSTVVIVRRALADRASRVARAQQAQPQVTAIPIAAEAAVFRNAAASFAADPSNVRRGFAHPRTMATWRMLRAFPGAPPRIPHGLTARELQTATCNTCHQRGGYSQRFGAYAPATPHPEQRVCTQCHLPDAAVTGVALPMGQAALEARCRQCHVPPAQQILRADTVSVIPVAEWPRVTATSPGGPPPSVPHDLQTRGNCLSCHSGPGAVRELRTTHAERTNCRQCHVLAEGAR